MLYFSVIWVSKYSIDEYSIGDRHINIREIIKLGNQMDETLRVSPPAGILWIVCNGNFDQSNQSTILPCAMLQAGRSGRIGLEADSETCHPSICLLLTLVQDISCTVPNIRYTIPNTKYTVPSTRYTISNTKYSVKNQMTLKTLIKKIPVVA